MARDRSVSSGTTAAFCQAFCTTFVANTDHASAGPRGKEPSKVIKRRSQAQTTDLVWFEAEILFGDPTEMFVELTVQAIWIPIFVDTRMSALFLPTGTVLWQDVRGYAWASD